MWTIMSEVVDVLLYCVFLEELGLLPTELGLTPTLSLYNEITIDTRDTYNHKECENHFSQDKADYSHMLTSKSWGKYLI